MPEPAIHSSGTGRYNSHSDADESEQDSHSEDERFSLCDYDLDVVDEALMNPNNSEYRDHFGFTIQVKTDDEDSSDSDSDREEPLNKKGHSATSSEDDDTDFSADTAMTTPTTTKLPPLEPPQEAPVRRSRSATVSKPTGPPPSVANDTPSVAVPGRRRRATTVSRPQPPPMPPLPAIITAKKPFETVGEEDEEVFIRHKQTTIPENKTPQGQRSVVEQQSIPEQPSENRFFEKQQYAVEETSISEQHTVAEKPPLPDQQYIDRKSPEQQFTAERTPQQYVEKAPLPPQQFSAEKPPIPEQQSFAEPQPNIERQFIAEQPPIPEQQQFIAEQPTEQRSSAESSPSFEQSPTSAQRAILERHFSEELSPIPSVPEKQYNTDHYVAQDAEKPIKELPPLPTDSVPMATTRSSASATTSDRESVRSTTSSEFQTHTRSRSESTSNRSFTSFNPFKRAGSPSSQSVRTGTRAVERPSAAFRERQSKRMSEFYRLQSSQPSSPSSSFHPGNRLSYASASSYYEMLMSKFGRSSEDQPTRDSPKQTALKDEAKQRLEDLKVEHPEYDYDFWEVFISDTDDMVRTQSDAVKHHMIAGIPSSMRGYVWQIMSKSRNNGDLESEYRELLKRISPHEKSIQRDLARTFPTHDFFKEKDGEGQEALFNVTKAYSLFDQQVGYCQGLPFIVGCLLLHMPDDMAFCVLIKIMSQYGLRGQFMPQMELLHERLFQFDHILQQKLPQIHKHLEAQGVQPSMYASQWFMTLFASRGPLHLVYRVFDMVLLEGSHVVLRFALALMFRNQHTLLNMDFEALVEFLNNAVFDTYKDDENGFVHDAYSMDIPTRLLNRLAKQHATEAAREAKNQSQEEHLRRINAELSSHVRRLEKSYRNLEGEHSEVTKQVIDAKMNVARLDDENQQLRWQLSQARTELDQLKLNMPVVEELQRSNRQLSQRNCDLENQLEDVEAILISLKMKYAESESNYEVMMQKLHKAGAL
ncbi:rab-GTPase-TBC domain-containing protein [Fennellomyces sp. T-0311]|nr:rab-GTPase-TBC domain-containing protein [Fennellomyces sp. T-0311]